MGPLAGSWLQSQVRILTGLSTTTKVASPRRGYSVLFVDPCVCGVGLLCYRPLSIVRGPSCYPLHLQILLTYCTPPLSLGRLSPLLDVLQLEASWQICRASCAWKCNGDVQPPVRCRGELPCRTAEEGGRKVLREMELWKGLQVRWSGT